MRSIDISGEDLIQPVEQIEPVLGWAMISTLVIDDTYQRPLGKSNWAQIRKIAREFSWNCFTPIIIANVGDGRYAVIDGQHRVHAAALCGFEKVPAMVIDINQHQQANTFAFVNGNVTTVSVFHVYKAALAAGWEWAVVSDACVKAAGCRLMLSNSSTNSKKSGDIYAISLIRQFVEKGQGDIVTAGLAALRAYDSNSTRVALYSAIILRPWLSSIAENPDFMKIDLAAFLEQNDPFKIIDKVSRLRKRPELKHSSAVKMERVAFTSLLEDFLAQQKCQAA